LVVLGLMVVYIQSGVISRIGLIVAVIAVWICFFAYCEREFKLKAEIGKVES
jgi:hypothetical protein